MITRRSFLYATSVTALASAVPWRLARAKSFGASNSAMGPPFELDDPALKELALRAIDAARAAGATYADVRFTSDRRQTVTPSHTFATVDEQGSVYVAVRALVAGGWGFASTPDCSSDAVVRLAREAVALASVNRWSTSRPIQLDNTPPAATGHWSTPYERDPFQVSIEEKADFLHSCVGAPELLSLSDVKVDVSLKFRRQEKVFASTTGAYVTQSLSWVGPSDINVTIVDPTSWQRLSLSAPAVPLQSGGYELVSPLRPQDRLLALVEEIYRQQFTTPTQIGRYSVVFDAQTAASLVRSTIGHATEMDRVRGDEVNAGGTSYLTEASLGTAIASRLLSITGTRSLSHGPAATGWDDDGIAPKAFPIVTDGTLVDFATNRATSSQLTAWYQQHNHPLGSRGCAVADSAADIPLIAPPDLVMRPAEPRGLSAMTFTDLVADAQQGIAVMNGHCAMDREQRTGEISGTCYEIRHGKLGRRLRGAVPVFHSTELWHNLVALGSASSAELRGFTSRKGEPIQEAGHGVLAVPMTVHNIAVLDATQG